MKPFSSRAKKEAEDTVAEAAPMTKLEERREELRHKFTELQFDLGGAAYEMAARDYFRLDVLAKMAARLQLVDAELAEIERMARLEKAGASGSCPGCGSLHAQGAVYCWRCGRNLHETTQAVVSPLAAVPSSGITDGSDEHVANGHDPEFHPAGSDLEGSASGLEEVVDPGLVGDVPDTSPGQAPPVDLGEGAIEMDPGPRNHPNLDHGAGPDRNQRPGWPPV